MLTAGCGGMGGAQPLAVTMNDGVCLIVDVDPHRLERRVETRYLDLVAPDLDDGAARDRGGARPGRAAARRPRRQRRRPATRSSLRRGVVPDVVTDQTSAHDPLVGYVPSGSRSTQAAELRASDPDALRRAVARLDGPPVSRRWSPSRTRGAVVFDYGNNLRAEAQHGGYAARLRYPGFVPAYVRPLFCQGIGRSAGPRSRAIPPTSPPPTRAIVELFPENEGLQRWIDWREERIAFQGLPARICWLGYGERHRAGLRLQRARRARARSRRRS